MGILVKSNSKHWKKEKYDTQRKQVSKITNTEIEN